MLELWHLLLLCKVNWVSSVFLIWFVPWQKKTAKRVKEDRKKVLKERKEKKRKKRKDQKRKKESEEQKVRTKRKKIS
jgi:hypothetical protein